MLPRILSKLPPKQKARLRGWYHSGKEQLVRRFLSYSPADLARELSKIGIREGDTLMVHCAYTPLLGFKGSPTQLIEVYLNAVGKNGNLLMVSMSYLSATSDYLQKIDYFDVRKSTSYMGLVSETFRRRPGVLRSLHPAHPVLAHGPQAKWIVSGHENCAYSCGPGSPFEKLVRLNGKVLFHGVKETNLTLHHYLEHLIKDKLPFPLYEDQPYNVKVIDYEGQVHKVSCYAFSKEAISRRRVGVLFSELAKKGQMPKARIGNTTLVLLSSLESVNCTVDMAEHGIFFYKVDSRISTSP
jgi:aminoglycoside 3-N-acetyltransferase